MAMIGINRKTAVLAVLLILIIKVAWAESEPLNTGRFNYSGDGVIRLVGEKSGTSFKGRYRQDSGLYDEKAYRSLCHVFSAPYDPLHLGLSLRLVEFLDFLQDRFGSSVDMIITSGYRTPAYNTHLRNQGGLAAKASLHQYGMAADLKMTGVSSRRIWDYVKVLGFGGAGYYHGDVVHIDVGPARSWDEKSSGVGTGISDDNKLIGLVTDYDRYRPGGRVLLRFIRMTAFPIGVDTLFELLPPASMNSEVNVVTFRPFFAVPIKKKCPQFADIEQLAIIQWQLPKAVPAGRYTIRAGFCDQNWAAMPDRVSTPEIEVVTP
jgi:uncharacterized protein YcbK (DUF882 family)